MRVGDAVRVKVAGQRRLERGLVAEIIPGLAGSAGDDRLPVVKVRLGLRAILAECSAITVIHKIHEKETVTAQVTSLQRAARALNSHRGNKRLASDLGTDDSQVGVEVGDRGLLDTTR